MIVLPKHKDQDLCSRWKVEPWCRTTILWKWEM